MQQATIAAAMNTVVQFGICTVATPTVLFHALAVDSIGSRMISPSGRKEGTWMGPVNVPHGMKEAMSTTTPAMMAPIGRREVIVTARCGRQAGSKVLSAHAQQSSASVRSHPLGT